ncbi:DUF4258 domain-containing protein [Reyranella sp.]|uniref:DUF4258 domain-containing protein n=1 Tax=Reyranella sp. TaxID=1929291 RepID=UPI00272FAC3F|nr:DUF4258 domain-containing protein [Reyranella sp.]MDP2374060.1 DUF4258 domain-containing protein [Reyranella sp.]
MKAVVVSMKFHKEQARLNAILKHKNCVIRYSRHAIDDEMPADQITHADVRHVLTKGHVTWFEIKKDEIVHVEGEDVDGRMIRIVVGLRDALITLMIITVMKLKT